MGRFQSLINRLRTKKIEPIITPIDKDRILKGKVAWIIGGSGGIGLSIAESFLCSGAKVIISGTNSDTIGKALLYLRPQADEDKLKGLELDLIKVASFQEKLRDALLLFPEQRVDILVNAAGLHHKSNFEEMLEDEYDRIMGINIKGTFFMCQCLCKYFRNNGIRGHILNVSSSSALRPAKSPYHLSKWALNGLTKGLAEMYTKYGIVVNAIAPGQTATPMLGITDYSDISNTYAFSGRYIMPQEVASLATTLVSDLGNMIIGETVYITGGSGLVTFNG